MDIVRKSWHVKVYENWYLAKHPQRHFLPDSANLCLYMRVILFWSWMRFFFLNKSKAIKITSWITVGIILQVIIAIVFGWKALGPIWGFLTIITLFIVIIAGVLGLADAIIYPYPVTKFTSLVKEYRKAAHDKICPMINFVD